MLVKTLFALVVLLGFNFFAYGQDKTVINDSAAKKMLLGKHRFSLQWISWERFGSATETEKNGVLYLKGEQRLKNSDDFVTVEGVITRVESKEFEFDGKIVTQVSHINNGERCERSGLMTFAITKNRKYWRLQQMDNPCDTVMDYVDIFFR